MLRETAERRGGRLCERAWPGRPAPQDRLERAIETYLPSLRRDPSWVLWIDVWGEALRDANLRRISEELDAAWVELIAEIIADGVAAGVFRCADPVASAWRLCALLDGLGLQVVLHQAHDDPGPDAQARPPRRLPRARLRPPRLTLRSLSRAGAQIAAQNRNGPGGGSIGGVQSSRLLAADRWSTRPGG